MQLHITVEKKTIQYDDNRASGSSPTSSPAGYELEAADEWKARVL
jgi:hypothetical protein